jgi:hypothetical protein
MCGLLCMTTILGKTIFCVVLAFICHMPDVLCEATDGTFVVGLFSSESRGHWEGVAAEQPCETFNFGVCKGV